MSNKQQYGRKDMAESHRQLVGVPTDDEMADLSAREAALGQELQSLHKMAGMFKSAGWTALMQRMLEDLRLAYAHLAAYDAGAELSDLKYIQGQIVALEHFMAQPQWLEQRRKQINAALNEIRAAQGDPDIEVVDEATTGR